MKTYCATPPLCGKNKDPGYRKILVNYASPKFTQSQKRNTRTGLRWGKFDRAVCYGPQDMDEAFRKKNHHILSDDGERGWCLWKPYIILKTLQQIKNGDYLFYSDSGSFFIDAIDKLIHLAETMEHDIVVPASPRKVIMETKRDTLILLDMDAPVYLNEHMRPSTYILLKKSPKSIKFIKEWLELAQDRRISTDDDNKMGKPNYPEFCFHRTQSIPTLLYIKHGLAGDHYMPIDQWSPKSLYGKLPPGFESDYLLILAITARCPNLSSFPAKFIGLLSLNAPVMKLAICLSSMIYRVSKWQATGGQAVIARDKFIRGYLKKITSLPPKAYRLPLRMQGILKTFRRT